MSEQTGLYRFFDADGGLLYVGISLSVLARQAQHRAGSEWFPLFRSQTVEYFDSRHEAEMAERAVIRAEHPRYNRAHNKKRTAAQERGIRNRWADRAAVRDHQARLRVEAERRDKREKDRQRAEIKALSRPTAADARVRSGDIPRVVKLHDLTPDQQRLVLALVRCAQSAPAAEAVDFARQKRWGPARTVRLDELNEAEREYVRAALELKRQREARAGLAAVERAVLALPRTECE